MPVTPSPAVSCGAGGEVVVAGVDQVDQGLADDGQVIQPLVPPGVGMLVGTVKDPDLGSVIAVGLDGLQACLTESAAFRLPPAMDTEADELIDSAKGVAAELNGLRGSAPLDREALRELILRLTQLLAEVPEVPEAVEADLNPVRCMTSGCLVLTCGRESDSSVPLTASRLGDRRPRAAELSSGTDPRTASSFAVRGTPAPPALCCGPGYREFESPATH
jgi:acyl-CoA synthetase (NDP forming)